MCMISHSDGVVASNQAGSMTFLQDVLEQFSLFGQLLECPLWNLVLLHSDVSTYAMINVTFIKVSCEC